jgi:hypothetical protein
MQTLGFAMKSHGSAEGVQGQDSGEKIDQMDLGEGFIPDAESGDEDRRDEWELVKAVEEADVDAMDTRA